MKKTGLSGLILLMLITNGIAKASSPAVPLILEAESAATYGVSLSNQGMKFSGTGFLTGFDAGDSIVFTFQAKKLQYELSFAVATTGAEYPVVTINNGKSRTLSIKTASDTFIMVSVGKVVLNEGSNTVVFKMRTSNTGSLKLDYLKVTPIIIAPPLGSSKQLSDTQATAVTKNLYSYLMDLYGKKVLSGQHELSDINYIRSKTTKFPAIGSFDLIEYSPSRRAYGSNPGRYTENAIQWATDNNTIIAMMWHWNAPTDLINTTGKEWWRGFYTYATTFDIEAVLNDTSSERYQLVLRDIDSIASQLKKIQAAGLPVLWRPLHEAAGGWFWWGAKGPEPLKKLWRLLYQRLTNYHQIHNLIWVFTLERVDTTWYPGDDYVDIVSLDLYPSSTTPPPTLATDWEAIKKIFNGRKPITLSEAGVLFNPDNARIYGTWWSGFTVWTGDFIRKVPLDELKYTYWDEDVLTADELPDWKNYKEGDSLYKQGDPLPNQIQSSQQAQSTISVYPNPAKDVIHISFNNPTTQPLTLDLYNSTGMLIKKIAIANYTTNISVDLKNQKKGLYFLKLNNGNMTTQCYKLIKQ